MVGKIIYDLLSNDTDVAAIVGTKIYPMRAGQLQNLPFIVYDIISQEPSQSKTGGSKMDTYRTQVSAFSYDYDELMDLMEKIRTALDQQSDTVGSVVVSDIVYEARNNLYDDRGNINGVALDFNCWEKRS